MRVRGLFFMTVATMLAASAVGHAGVLGPPYPDAHENEGCPIQSRLYVCESDASAHAATGRFSLLASVQSRLQGYAPGYATYSSADVGFGGMRYANAAEVQALRFTATLHVDQAIARVMARPPVVGHGQATVYAGIALQEDLQRCYDRVCSTSSQGGDVVSRFETGETVVVDQDVTTTQIYYGCGGLPPGEVRISVFVFASASLGDLISPSAGAASTSVNAVLTSIVVDEVPVPPGACAPYV